MDSKKGSAILWTIIIVLILVIAIGSYFILSNKESSSESSNNIAPDGGSAGGETIVSGDDDSINQDSNEENPSSSDLSCTDSDGGRDYSVKGETCNEVDCKIDVCTSMPVSDNVVAEYYCESNERKGVVGAFCDYKCEDGACIPKPEPKCTDTDGGKDYSIRGKVTVENIPGNSGEFEDRCLDSERLMENYCGPGQGYDEGLEVAKVTIYGCPNECQDGTCI